MPLDAVLVERFIRDTPAASWNLIEPQHRFGVAVSGGADSLALLLLAAAAFPGRIAAVSIDHGLRAASAAECAFVAEVCAGLGVPHEVIAVDVVDDGEGIQSAARFARHEAFGTWCQRTRSEWMMTGHHADDQAETVLMRLARGSGVTGLSGIRTMATLPFDPDLLPPDHELVVAQALRPLLGWRRAELTRIVKAAGLVAVDDASNRDRRFDRTRFRELVACTDLIDPLRVAQAARNCEDADAALGWMTLRLGRMALSRAPDRITLDLAPLKPWHVEIMRRMLLDVFAHFRAWPRPRGAQLVRLLGLLMSGRTATLAGIKAVPRDGVWTFTRAPPRRSG